MEGPGRIGRPVFAVKVPLFLALVLLALAIPGRSPTRWNVLAVIVPSIDVPVPSLDGEKRLRFDMSERQRTLVHRELSSFCRRVRRDTKGLLSIRLRTVEAKQPLRTLSGPGPYWLGPRDAAGLLRGLKDTGWADTVMVFAQIGEKGGDAVPVRYLGATVGGDRGPAGACFTGITFRPGWIDGSGTVALHEWLHGLRWALTEVDGFSASSLPDPDDGHHPRSAPAGSPHGDGPFADYMLRKCVTARMIRGANPRRGPARSDDWIRDFHVPGRRRALPYRTVTLSPERDSARASIPPGTDQVLVISSAPVLVRSGKASAIRVERRKTVTVSGPTLRVESALAGGTVWFRVRAIKGSTELTAHR